MCNISCFNLDVAKICAILLVAAFGYCASLVWFCTNGGTAVDTGKSCECQCSAGYTGEHCQTGARFFFVVFFYIKHVHSNVANNKNMRTQTFMAKFHG